jgi:hypothetical protein
MSATWSRSYRLCKKDTTDRGSCQAKSFGQVEVTISVRGKRPGLRRRAVAGRYDRETAIEKGDSYA